jgi:hypothetical protein
LELFAVALAREEELRPFEPEDLFVVFVLVVFGLEREFEFDPFGLDDVRRFEPLGDPLRFDVLAFDDDFLDPPERRAVERDACFATVRFSLGDCRLVLGALGDSLTDLADL